MKLIGYFFIFSFFFSACSSTKDVKMQVIDTDFSKGRMTHLQTITLRDLEKFHGHLCDGLVVGALAMKQSLEVLYPDHLIDRTNLRVVSKPSPCLTDVAIYITGGRYQFNTFYVDASIQYMYLIQRMDNGKTVGVNLNQGIKPAAIDSLGNLAIKMQLSPCGLDSLRKMEDDFTKFLFKANPNSLFKVSSIEDFTWSPVLNNDFIKTDVLNKNSPKCEIK